MSASEYARATVEAASTAVAGLHPWDERREAALDRLATSFLVGAGFTHEGERAGGRGKDETHLLEPGRRIDRAEVERTWAWISADLREAVEARCTKKQLRALKLRAHGLTVSESARVEGIRPTSMSERIGTARKRVGKNPPRPPTYEGKNVGADSDRVAHSEATEKPIMVGPRSPESDPERVRLIPFSPHYSRPDLYWVLNNTVPVLEDSPSVFEQNRHPGMVGTRTARMNGVPLLERVESAELAAVESRIAREQDRRARKGWASPQDRLRVLREWYARPALVIPFPVRERVEMKEAA